ncbi:polysaccharide biosynthesis tyrosine autokinase [Actinomycetospora sp. CA-101289]|uniref:polysaccharide biosynthesis tyrosine autokinase n=1 Tax=Actinomycetospora sp. CA-101289 TaxID=3239893 RepID=UPI003D96D2F0
MPFSSYLRVLREQKLVIASLVIAGLVVAGLVTIFSSPQYAARFTVYVSTPVPPGNSYDAFQGEQLSQDKVKSYVQLLSSPRVTRDVVDRLDLDTTPDELAAHITASAEPQTVLITAEVTAGSPEGAVGTADAVAASFIDLVGQLERATSFGGSPAVTATLVDPPTVLPEAISPRPALNFSLGAFIGLALGLGLAFARHALDTSVKSEEQLRNAAGASCIGVIPFVPSVAAPDPGLRIGPDRELSEAARKIRTNLTFISLDGSKRVFAITSAVAGEGKTVTALSLGWAIAASDLSVLVVEADLRRPSIAGYLGMEDDIGLTTVLTGRASLREVVQRHAPGGFDVITSGPLPPNPSEVLESPQMARFLRDAAGSYDIVIVDTAPLNPVTDTVALASSIDEVVLVCRYGRTSRSQVQAAATALANVSLEISATVLAMSPEPTPTYDQRTPYRIGARALPVPEQTGPRPNNGSARPSPSPRTVVLHTREP